MLEIIENAPGTRRQSRGHVCALIAQGSGRRAAVPTTVLPTCPRSITHARDTPSSHTSTHGVLPEKMSAVKSSHLRDPCRTPASRISGDTSVSVPEPLLAEPFPSNPFLRPPEEPSCHSPFSSVVVYLRICGAPQCHRFSPVAQLSSLWGPRVDLAASGWRATEATPFWAPRDSAAGKAFAFAGG